MIVDSIINIPKRKVTITGVPGAGKTTLAQRLSNTLDKSSFLYLSFGKENTLAARARLGNNVTCLSIHALAKKSMNINTKRLCSKTSMSMINATLKAINCEVDSNKELEALATLLNMFCMSATALERVQDLMLLTDRFPILTNEEKERVNIAFRAYWSSLWTSGSNSPITHDIYLKEFSLRNNRLHYDFVMVDEKQDLNDAMYALIDGFTNNNPSVKVISFGDPCQQIFGFRGASKRFLSEDYHFKLTTSHRFGKRLCQLSNNLMSNQEISYYTPIHSKTDNTVIEQFLSYQQLVKHINNGNRPTYISRYNMTLWHMLKFLSLNGFTCALSGGVDSSELNFLKALHELKNNGTTRHHSLKNLSYESYLRAAKVNDDKSSLLACKFVESIDVDSQHDLFEIMSNAIKPANQAQILLTTVHQAKGLEFKDVWISRDFPKTMSEDGKFINKIKREEAHLIYTAITRARNSLTIPDDLYCQS